MAIQLTLHGLALPVPPVTLEVARPLWHFPAVASATLCENAALIGAAGEALCDSILLRFGLLPMSVPGSMATDRLVHSPGGLFRLQVKAASAARDGAFHFVVSKGYRNAPRGIRGYDPDDYDMLALVLLSENVVAFTSEHRPSYRIRVAEIPRLRTDPRASLEEALLRLGLDPDPRAPDADLLPPCAA